jgi:S1-C subfamily serine protease
LIVAIPAGERLAERAERLWSGNAASPVRLGVAIAPPRVARRLRRAVGLPERDGLLVRSVAEGSAAQAAGIERGDLIVAAKGEPVERVDALYEALDSLAEGDTLALRVVRGTEERDVPVTFDAHAEAVR